MKTYILASNNAGKRKEIEHLLQLHGIELIPPGKYLFTIEETGLTFVENAILKARQASKISGLPAIADDSGLCVDILAGKPGIYSARFAGNNASDEDNIELLLQNLYLKPDELRTASFYCVIVRLLHPEDPSPLICQGIWHGRIAKEPQGAGGFGYDPIFYLPSLQKTAAELPLSTKNTISHRGQALKILIDKIAAET